MGRIRSPDLVHRFLGQETQNYPLKRMVAEIPETGLDDNSITNQDENMQIIKWNEKI